MDLSKLNGLSTESLTKMQAHIQAVLNSRLDITLRVGRHATFKDGQGLERRIIIERINGKSVSGHEVGSSVKPGCKWRVSKGAVSVVPQERTKPMKLAVPHIPTAYKGELW